MKAPLHSMLLNNHSVKWIWHVKGSLCGCLVHKLAIYTALDTAYPFYYLCLGALNDQKFGSLNLSNVLGVRPPFTIGADGVKVLTLRNKYDNVLFYYYFLKSIKIVDKGYSRHFKYLKEKKLPIANYPDQLHIANLLSKAENLIS